MTSTHRHHEKNPKQCHDTIKVHKLVPKFVGGVGRINLRNSTVVKLLAAPAQGKAREEEHLVVKHFPDLYGFRGHLPEYKDVYYLNPWEFLMLWEVRRLPEPTETTEGGAPSLSQWLKKAPKEGETKFVVNPAAEIFYHQEGGVLFYPEINGTTPSKINQGVTVLVLDTRRTRRIIRKDQRENEFFDFSVAARSPHVRNCNNSKKTSIFFSFFSWRINEDDMQTKNH